MSQQADDTDDDVEFDENDNKIIQLYEVINELIDEQKSRVEDLELLYVDQGDIVLQNVEQRNNSVLNQIYSELQLKEKNDDEEEEEEEEENTDSDDDSEDEQDQGWEIYNTVVNNLNGYMGQIALFSQKLKEHREMVEHMEVPQDVQEEEVKELENVVEQQTLALESQMKRNDELESALGSVLNEYSNRINSSNKEIASLHQQLSLTNKQHATQIKELRVLYEKKIAELQQTQDTQYKEEVTKLIESLSSSRMDFQKQIVSLTQEMGVTQTTHRQEMLTLTKHIQTLTEEKSRLLQELQNKIYNKLPKLHKTRTVLDIDDEEEFFYTKLNINTQQSLLNYNGIAKKNRTFTPSGYTDNNQQQLSQGSRQYHKSDQTNGQSALQAKYAQHKRGKGYKRQSKNKYSQKTY